MSHINTITVILFFLLFNTGYSQGKDYQDYMVTKSNDTLYGTYQLGFFKWYFVQFNPDETDLNKQLIKHKTTESKSFRFNDYIGTGNIIEHIGSNGLYGVSVSPHRKRDTIKYNDYVVTRRNDTIRGDIQQSLIGRLYLHDSIGNKIKINKRNVVIYCKDNFIYELKKRKKVDFLERRWAYMLVLYKTRDIKLYTFAGSGGMFYHLEKNNQEYMITTSNYIDKVKELFYYDKSLMYYFYNVVYSYENMYLMVKYHSRKGNI